MVLLKRLLFIQSVLAVTFVASASNFTTNSTDVSQDVLSKRIFYTECTTPNSDIGICMRITNCDKLKAQLNNTDARDFLRSSSCGPRLSDGWVCCGKYNNYLNYTTERNFEEPLPVESKKTTLLPSRCGHQPISIPNRIIGGELADLGEFPWMARLMHKDKSGYENVGCAGFLVHRRFVLTAAHCVNSTSLQFLGPLQKIVFGEYDTTTNPDCVQEEGDEVCAKEIVEAELRSPIIHPGYNPSSRSQENDIALIPLKNKINFTEYIQPICLPDVDSKSQAVAYFLTGWGKTEKGEASTVKLKVTVPLQSNDECRVQYKTINVNVTEKQICAGGIEGKDSCSGDSGGPLMYFANERWYAAGVVSFGLGCGKEGWPAIYTNIVRYREWIDSEIYRKNEHPNKKSHRRRDARSFQ